MLPKNVMFSDVPSEPSGPKEDEPALATTRFAGTRRLSGYWHVAATPRLMHGGHGLIPLPRHLALREPEKVGSEAPPPT